MNSNKFPTFCGKLNGMKALKFPRFKSGSVVCLFLLLLWLIAIWLVEPTGNFPLNDDWNYAHAVKTLLEEGRLRFTCWTLAASLSNVLGATCFCALFGFSFDVLRSFSLCAALVGAQALFVLAKTIGKDQSTALIAALTLLFNPLYFSLAFTFMNDVPFVALSVLCAMLFTRLLARGRQATKLDIFYCLLASTLTCLSRQVGLVIPLGYALAAASSHSQVRVPARQIAVQLIVPILAVTCFQAWLSSTGDQFYSYRTEEAYIKSLLANGLITSIISFAINWLRAGIYIGLFLLPFLLPWCCRFLLAADKKRRLFFAALCLEICAAVGLGLWFTHSLMPLADNILYDFGLGPVILPKDPTSAAPPIAGSHEWFWLAVTAAGVLGFSLLSSSLITMILHVVQARREKRELKDLDLCRFYSAVLILYLSTICFRGFFDRYLIFALPFFMLLLASYNNENSDVKESFFLAGSAPITGIAVVTSAVLCLAFALFSVLGTHDYLMWNRVRWEALRYLQEDLKIAAERIDGGLEFNGWVAYGKDSAGKKPVFNTEMRSADDYAVAMTELPGFEQLRCFDYPSYLTGTTGYIYALKKYNQK